MTNDDERDYAEEAYNRALLQEAHDPEPDPSAVASARGAWWVGEARRVARDLGQSLAPSDEHDRITVSAEWLAGVLKASAA